MDRRGFVTTGMAAGLAGASGAGALGTLVGRLPGWGPGKTDVNGVIRLSSNENALGISPAAREALIAAIVDANRYPGDYGDPLIEAIAAHHDVRPENVTLGFGSTEILQVSTHAFQGPNVPLVVAQPTFEDITDYEKPIAYDVITVPLNSKLEHDLDRMREAAEGRRRPAVVYFCNPNNPTGTITPSRDIDAWIADAPETTIFLMDEAYWDYADSDDYWSALKWIETHPNVLVIRTFSKIYAMAGLRLGYCLSHPDTAARLQEWTVQNNPNVLSAAAGIASLQDEGLSARSLASNNEAKQITIQTLDELGLEHLPTQANFLMHRISGDLRTYQNRMAEAGIRVGRPFPPMLEYNRLSFGLPEEMDRWATTLKDFRRKGWV